MQHSANRQEHNSDKHAEIFASLFDKVARWRAVGVRQRAFQLGQGHLHESAEDVGRRRRHRPKDVDKGTQALDRQLADYLIKRGVRLSEPRSRDARAHAVRQRRGGGYQGGRLQARPLRGAKQGRETIAHLWLLRRRVCTRPRMRRAV